MNRLRQLPLASVCLLLATCLCLALIYHFCPPSAPEEPPVPVTELDLSGTPIESLDNITAHPELEYLDLRDTGLTTAEYEILRGALPNCEILWDVPFQGRTNPLDTKNLTITTLSEEDLAVLDYLTRLEFIDALGCSDYVQLNALRLRKPDCRVDYRVTIDGRTYNCAEQQLTLPGEDADGLTELLRCFPDLRDVTLEQPLDEGAALRDLAAAYPQVSFHWTLTFKDMPLDSDTTTTLDLTGIPTTVEEMEALLPYLPNLTYVDMTDCGISNEEMDALNRRHENVKIVWTVALGDRFTLKTDATYFMPRKKGFAVGTEDAYNLRYCTDIIALDFGHMKMGDISFCAFMPNLQFLLLCETPVTDLSPLTGLKNLVYLEIFMTPITDYSPLLTLTGLEDLNIGYTYGDPQIIAQMTWLKNCWWSRDHWETISPEDQQMLRDALPDCNFNFRAGFSTGYGWRDLPNYFKQRDIFGMSYMTG